MGVKSLYPVDGNTLRLDGGAMFGNVPKVIWQKWMTPDEENRITLATRALLVKTHSGKHILFEAGVGSFFDPKLKLRYGIQEKENLLLKNLENLGVSEDQIDAVVLSHLHFDHAGGLFHSYENKRLLFANAHYFVGRKHWEWAQNPSPRERASFIPELHAALLQSGRMQLIEEDQDLKLGFNLSFISSVGHTHGMLLAELDALIFVSDLVPALPWVHLPITMGYDRFSEKKVEEKEALYNRACELNKKLFLTHDPNHAMISVAKHGERETWRGVSCEEATF
jgi:glyoxylase-like metal-dependent hydrolase (beta-lactamase superfamily II)